MQGETGFTITLQTIVTEFLSVIARLRLEELFSSTLARAQKLELDRLKAIKSVITTYNGTLAAMNTPLQLSSERSALLSEAFVPLSDLNTTIEQYKTGTFRPRPNVWTDFYHETTDVRFGVDLKHWYDMNSESGPSASNQKIPDVLEQLLDTLRAGYPNLKDDAGEDYTFCRYVESQLTLFLVQSGGEPGSTKCLYLTRIACAICSMLQALLYHWRSSGALTFLFLPVASR